MQSIMSQGERNGRARVLFGELLHRHGLSAYWEHQDWAHVVVELPPQPGLAFSVTLAFQKENELLLSCQGLAQAYWPWPKEKTETAFRRAVNGLLSGKARLVRRLNAQDRAYRIVLEEATAFAGEWRKLAAATWPLAFPIFGGGRTEIVCNRPNPATLAFVLDTHWSQ